MKNDPIRRVWRVTILLLLLMAANVADGVVGSADRLEFGPPEPSHIRVVYPKDSQSIGAVDSTFILGSVAPGSHLEINGTPVDVYRTGGFLAYLPVHSGVFHFRLRATKGTDTDSLDWPVVIADPSPIPADSGVRIRPGSIRPRWNRTVHAQDEIDIGFDGTVGCRARFRIIAGADTLGPFPMAELRREAFSDFRSFRQDALLEPDPLSRESRPPARRGRYHGVWRVPVGLTADTLRILVELTGWSARAVRTQAPWPDSIYGPPSPPDTTTETISRPVPGAIVPVDALPPRVVELTDSVQILRMGPRLGYLTILQPYGVRARWWGQFGPWTILQPVPGYEAWIETDKTRLLPDGTPLPGSDIARLSTRAEGRTVKLYIGTSERLPFKVVVDDDLQSIRILLFGATSNTDWIEQDPADHLISNIAWSQVQPRLYQVSLRLTEPLWGYDAHYENRRFVLELRRAPVVRSGLKGVTVVVDPGHSADPGAIGPTGLMEKDANLSIARAVRRLLRARGARVVMTRTGDDDVPLYDRPAIAVANRADLFVSIHNNAVPDGVDPRRRNGTATYYYHPFSRDLARAVHRRMLQETRLDDYGLTQGNFAVIRPTQYPSVLVECAFIIIPEQEELLVTPGFIRRAAKGIADGITDFLRQHRRN